MMEALAWLLAEVAHGCAASAMVFCVVNAVRATLALAGLFLPQNFVGRFSRLGYTDHTT